MSAVCSQTSFQQKPCNQDKPLTLAEGGLSDIFFSQKTGMTMVPTVGGVLHHPRDNLERME